jgi:hypothetical protein
MKRGRDFDSINEILSSKTLFGVVTETIHTRTIVPKDILDHLIIQTFRDHMDCKFTEIVWRSTFTSLENADPTDLSFIKGILTIGCSMCGVAGRALWEEDKACTECTKNRTVQVIPSDDGSFKRMEHFPKDSIVHDFVPFIRASVLPTPHAPHNLSDNELWMYLSSKISDFFQECGGLISRGRDRKILTRLLLFSQKKELIDDLERSSCDLIAGRLLFNFVLTFKKTDTITNLLDINAMITQRCAKCGKEGCVLWQSDKCCSKCTQNRDTYVFSTFKGEYRTLEQQPKQLITCSKCLILKEFKK